MNVRTIITGAPTPFQGRGVWQVVKIRLITSIDTDKDELWVDWGSTTYSVWVAAFSLKMRV